MLGGFFTELIRSGLPIAATAFGTVYGTRRGVKWGIVGAAAGWTGGYVTSRLLLTVLEGGDAKIPKYSVQPPPEVMEPPSSTPTVDQTLKGMEAKQQAVQPTVSPDNTVVQFSDAKSKKPRQTVVKTGPPGGFGFDPGGSV